MSTNYEPTPEQRVALMDDIRVRTQCDLYKLGPNILDAILTRQHEREAGLLLAVAQLATLGGGHSDGNRIAQAALAAHARLDAPPEPTVEQAAAALIASAPQIIFGHHPRTMHPMDADGAALAVVRPAALAALKAAVERAERTR